MRENRRDRGLEIGGTWASGWRENTGKFNDLKALDLRRGWRFLGDRVMGKASLLWLEALFTIALLSTLTERAKAGPKGEHRDDEDDKNQQCPHR